MKLFVLALTLMLAGCFHSDGSSGTPVAITATPPERITFAGGGALGVFDPSITEDPATGTLWMSYSAVDISMFYLPTVYWTVSIRLASSTDNGVSWQDAGIVITPYEEVALLAMAENNPDFDITLGMVGIWQSETSSLIYDPGAPVNERWKLIWFQYLNANLVNYFSDYGWIAMRMAATPAGLAVTPMSPAVKLFAGFAIQPETEITATTLLPHIADAPAFQLNSDPMINSFGGADLNELSRCVFAEPGLHATNTAVYMAIFCADVPLNPLVDPITEYLVYFRCTSPCTMANPANWEYLGRLLTPADALAATGDDHFQAPALVERNGKTYLVVTPVEVTLDAMGDEQNRYNGCRVYEFTDINSNVLRRFGGQLVQRKRIDGEAGTHNGACAAWNGLDGGIMLSQFDPATTPETFRMFKSQVSVP